MTTIAYKDGVIAWDSRVTAENFIVDDEYDKHVVIADIHFFCSGATEFVEDFCSAYAAHGPTVKDMDVSATVKRTMKFDAATGGRVHTFQVPVAVQHVPV